MNATVNTTKRIDPSFVVQKIASHKVFVYLSMPELKVKRSFLHFLKLVPSNGRVRMVDFQNHSFTLTINIKTKLYSISIARLPGKIQPGRCSIKYQCGGCWVTLFKVDPTPWTNRIYEDLGHGFNIQEDNDPSQLASAPTEEVPSEDTDMPPPYNLVSRVPSAPSQPATKKRPAPPPPFNLVPRVPSAPSQPTTKKRPAPPPPFNLVPRVPSAPSQPTTKKRPAPPPPFNLVPRVPSAPSQPTTKKRPAPPPPTN